MTYKVVRDASGIAVCFGPNDDNYVPMIPAGCVLVIELTEPAKNWLAIKTAEVKAEAQRRIFARYPQWKQANLNGRTTKLLAIEAGKYRDSTGVLQPARALTASEIQEIADASVAMAWIESVRAASGLIESDINAATDPASFDVAGSPRWPA